MNSHETDIDGFAIDGRENGTSKKNCACWQTLVKSLQFYSILEKENAAILSYFFPIISTWFNPMKNLSFKMNLSK